MNLDLDIRPLDVWGMACFEDFPVGQYDDNPDGKLTPFGALVAGTGMPVRHLGGVDYWKIPEFLRALADAVELDRWDDIDEIRGWRWGKISLKTGEVLPDE